jgi:hypothetical protein
VKAVMPAPGLGAVLLILAQMSVQAAPAGKGPQRVWKAEVETHKITEAQGGAVTTVEPGGRTMTIRRSDPIVDDLSSAGGKGLTASFGERRPAASLADGTTGGGAITNAVLHMTRPGQDLSQKYVETFGTFSFVRRLSAGGRMVCVECDLVAKAADRDAVQRLDRVRQAQANRQPSIAGRLALTDDDRLRLKNGHQFFDLSSIQLTEAGRIVYRPVWICLPPTARGPYFLETGGQPLSDFTPPPPPWAKTFLTAQSFTGMLEVGKPVHVELLFTVAQNAQTGKMGLKIGAGADVAVRVAN